MLSSVGELRRTLKLRHVVVLGFAYMSPFGVFDTFGIASDATKGFVPMAYILVTIAILFTALSYAKLVQIYPFTGSAYTYTTKTMGGHLGFIVGWAVLLDYLFLPMINALLAYIYLSSGFPNVPGWVWIVGLIVIITALNIVGVRLSASVNVLMVLFQLLVVVIFIILITNTILNGPESFSLFPFYSEELNAKNLFAGAAILALSFTGFDAVTTMTEETINPKQTIAKAVVILALAGGAYLIFVTYFMQTLFPDVSILSDIDGASPEIAYIIGGTAFQSFFLAGALVSVLSSGLASQTSASRLLYGMGRDGVLPRKVFAYVHPKYNTPVFSICIVGIIALTAIFLDLDTTVSLINFGVFTAFSFVNLSLIVYYFKNRKLNNSNTLSWFRYVVCPAFGFLFLIYLGTSLDKLSITLGLSWTTIGFIYLLFMTKFFRVPPPSLDYGKNE